MAAFESFHWLIPPPVTATGKIPLLSRSGQKLLSITRPDPIYWYVSVAIPVVDSPCHESQKRHYRFGHGPLTQSDSCKSTGLSAEGTDGERVMCHLFCTEVRTLYVHSPEYTRSSIWRPPLLPYHLVGPLLCASHSQCRVQRHYYDIHWNGVRTPVIRITGKEVAPSISIENTSNSSSPLSTDYYQESSLL